MIRPLPPTRPSLTLVSWRSPEERLSYGPGSGRLLPALLGSARRGQRCLFFFCRGGMDDLPVPLSLFLASCFSGRSGSPALPTARLRQGETEPCLPSDQGRPCQAGGAGKAPWSRCRPELRVPLSRPKKRLPEPEGPLHLFDGNLPLPASRLKRKSPRGRQAGPPRSSSPPSLAREPASCSKRFRTGDLRTAAESPRLCLPGFSPVLRARQNR